MLSPESLDAFAHEYYLNQGIDTIDLEERAQLHSVPRLLEAIGDRAPVLEMGFGTGLITAELLRHDVPLEIVEGSPVLVDEARRRHPTLPVHHAMFETFEPTRHYGAVLALHVLEHVDDPVAVLDAMHPWLADDGALVVVVPNAESLHRRIAVEMGLHERLDDLGPSDKLVGHQRVYDLDRLTADLDAAGYDVTFDFGYLLKTVPNSMMLEYPSAMVEALNTISDRIPTRDLANIGVRAIPRRGGSTSTVHRTGTITALVLADGDAMAASITASSVEDVADHIRVLDRSVVDWTDSVVTGQVIDEVTDEWILVVGAGERLRVGDPAAFRADIRDSDDDAVTLHVGLGAEVRLHRRSPAAMLMIGSPDGDPIRSAAVVPADVGRDGDPAVSVIVPTFNRPELLARCLRGLSTQTTDDLEVIVVNDGGLDVSDVVAAFRHRLDVRLTTQASNGGAAAAANAGLASARGRYAHFQADDDTVQPHHVQLLQTVLDDAREQGEPLSVVYGPALMLHEDERGEVSSAELVFHGHDDPQELRWRNVIVGGTAMFDLETARRIDGMNTDYEVLEDWDFWLRMAAEGPIRYIDAATAEYRMRPGTANVTTQAKPRFYDSLLRLYREHPVAPGSEAEEERAAEIERQADTHRDGFAWDHTLAVIGNGDLQGLVATIQRGMQEAGTSSLQLIVHERRSPEADAVLRDLARDATVCLHEEIDDDACRARIARQAGGREVRILTAG